MKKRITYEGVQISPSSEVEATPSAMPVHGSGHWVTGRAGKSEREILYLNDDVMPSINKGKLYKDIIYTCIGIPSKFKTVLLVNRSLSFSLHLFYKMNHTIKQKKVRYSATWSVLTNTISISNIRLNNIIFAFVEATGWLVVLLTHHASRMNTCWRQNMNTMFTKITFQPGLGNTFIVDLIMNRFNLFTRITLNINSSHDYLNSFLYQKD